jgi:hypothetical protein
MQLLGPLKPLMPLKLGGWGLGAGLKAHFEALLQAHSMSGIGLSLA